MLIQEPMLLAITLYMSFVYGVVYLLFEAFPYVFVQVSSPYKYYTKKAALIFRYTTSIPARMDWLSLAY